jgi:hypothetical protein
MSNEITVGIIGGFDVSTGAKLEKRVYIEVGGRVRAFSPAGARDIAQKYRKSGLPDLIELANDIEALALEIETTVGET